MERRESLWFKMKIEDVSPGDFLMVHEDGAWVPRLVRHMKPAEYGRVLVKWWDPNRKYGHWETYQPEEVVDVI